MKLCKRIILLGWLVALTAMAAERRPAEWVDPLIDTHASRWFYFNSACRPFGMVNLSPDTQTVGTWNSGYLYTNSMIRCFSHIHAWQLSGIPVMPITGEMTGPFGMDAYQSEFSHDEETVRAGYHRVRLKKYGIEAELTSTTRVGFHRYTFPETEDAYVLLDTGAFLGHGPMVRSAVRRVNATEVEGMALMKATVRRKKDTAVYFVAQFSQPMTAFGGWMPNEESVKTRCDGVDEIAGNDSGAYVRFATVSNQPLMMKVAISYTSIEGARRNLEAELPHWGFDRVVRESSEDWNEHLSRIEVAGGTDAQRTKFYTDLWRAMLGRRVVSDADGAYCDMTGSVPVILRVPLDSNGAPAFNMHNFDAWWGSHWSLNILWPLLCPERYSAICNTSVEMYKNGGLIPRGPSGGNYTFVMIGDTAAPALTAAYAKGIRDFDLNLALEGLVKNTGPEGGRYYGGYADAPAPAAHADYTQKGYIAWGHGLSGFHGEAVSSLTLYNAYHDWCIAQMAQGLGREDLVERFASGATNYLNVIWREKQSAWVRDADGNWLPEFSPTAAEFEQKGFCETSAAISTFFVPHDPPGLAAALGGPAAAAEKLDQQFRAAEAYHFYKTGREHGLAEVDYANQDGTGMAHVFNRIGYPWLSQKWVRAVQKQTFSGHDPFSGYHGDEDQGQMGALSALLAMGLFQFDGGSSLDSQYDITAPLFDKVTIHLSPRYYGGKTVEIIAKNQAPENIYIQSLTWNGVKLPYPLLPHAELVKGGVLEMELGPVPKQIGFQGAEQEP